MEKGNGVVRILKALGIWVVTLVIMMPLAEDLLEWAVEHWGFGTSSVHWKELGILYYLIVVTAAYVFFYLIHRRQLLKEEQLPAFVDYVKKFFSWSVGLVCGVMGGVILGVLLLFVPEAFVTLIFLILMPYMHPFLEIDTDIEWSLLTDELYFWVIMVVIGVCCYLFADMLIRYSFHKANKADWIGCGEFLVVLALCCASGYGLAKVEEQIVPKLEDVEAAYVDMDYRMGSFWGTSGCKVEYAGTECQKIIDIHEQILADKGYYQEVLDDDSDNTNDVEYEHVVISYTLKDGSSCMRNYRIPKLGKGQDVIEEIVALELEPERFLQKVFGKEYDSLSVFESGIVTLYSYNLWKNHAIINAEEKEITLTAEECKELYQAIIADAKAGTIEKYNGSHLCYEHIDATEEKKHQIRLSIPQADKGETESIWVEYGKDCMNILDTLARLGCIESVEHFCWEEPWLVKTDIEVYLENVLCYDYDRIHRFVYGGLELGYHILDDAGETQSVFGTYVLSDEAEYKAIYEAIVRDWLDGKLLKYNTYYATEYVEEYTGNDNVYTFTMSFLEPGTNLPRDARIRYGSDCENIINAIVELGIVTSTDRICWDCKAYDVDYDRQVEVYEALLRSYKEWENVTAVLSYERDDYEAVALNEQQIEALCETAIQKLDEEGLELDTTYLSYSNPFEVSIQFYEPNSTWIRNVRFGFGYCDPYFETVLLELGLYE